MEIFTFDIFQFHRNLSTEFDFQSVLQLKLKLTEPFSADLLKYYQNKFQFLLKFVLLTLLDSLTHSNGTQNLTIFNKKLMNLTTRGAVQK